MQTERSHRRVSETALREDESVVDGLKPVARKDIRREVERDGFQAYGEERERSSGPRQSSRRWEGLLAAPARPSNKCAAQRETVRRRPRRKRQPRAEQQRVTVSIDKKRGVGGSFVDLGCVGRAISSTSHPLSPHETHDLADLYEQAMAKAQPPQPIDYVGEALRRIGLDHRRVPKSVGHMMKFDGCRSGPSLLARTALLVTHAYAGKSSSPGTHSV